MGASGQEHAVAGHIFVGHVDIERHVVEDGRWGSAASIGGALAEACADGGRLHHRRKNAVVVIGGICTILTRQVFLRSPIPTFVGAVQEGEVAARAFQHGDGGAPDAVSIVVGQWQRCGVSQEASPGVHAVGAHFDVGGVDIEGQIVVNELVGTSVTRFPAHHVEVGVGLEGEGAVGVAVDGRRAGFTTREVLLVVPAIHGELVFDGAWIQGQGHRPNAVPFRV